MSDVFLDTVGLLALWNTSDQWHPAASAAYQDMLERKQPALTTKFVLLECGNAAARNDLLRPRVAEARRWFARNGRLVVPTDDDSDAAWAAYERGEAGHACIVDQVSFAVMRRLRLTQAFTNDRHFTAAGFETLF